MKSLRRMPEDMGLQLRLSIFVQKSQKGKKAVHPAQMSPPRLVQHHKAHATQNPATGSRRSLSSAQSRTNVGKPPFAKIESWDMWRNCRQNLIAYAP